MKLPLFLLAILFTGLSSVAQSYLGTITKQAYFRAGPGNDYKIIDSLQPDTQIFIVSLKAENDFYNIIDIQTNKEGFVHRSFVKPDEQIKENNRDVFSSSGKSASYNPVVEIFYNTSLILTLKLNAETYLFSPKEKRSLTIEPGLINYRASAPGVIPNIGSQKLQSNQGYSWQFYILISD